MSYRPNISNTSYSYPAGQVGIEPTRQGFWRPFGNLRLCPYYFLRGETRTPNIWIPNPVGYQLPHPQVKLSMDLFRPPKLTWDVCDGIITNHIFFSIHLHDILLIQFSFICLKLSAVNCFTFIYAHIYMLSFNSLYIIP